MDLKQPHPQRNAGRMDCAVGNYPIFAWFPSMAVLRMFGSYVRAQTRKHKHAHTHTHIHTHIHTWSCTHTHTHAHTHTNTHTNTYTHAHIHTQHNIPHKHTHACTHIYIHTHNHAHTNTRTHTHKTQLNNIVLRLVFRAGSNYPTSVVLMDIAAVGSDLTEEDE